MHSALLEDQWSTSERGSDVVGEGTPETPPSPPPFANPRVWGITRTWPALNDPNPGSAAQSYSKGCLPQGKRGGRMDRGGCGPREEVS